MFTIRVLGGATVEGGGVPLVGRAAQRRRVALLALLAAAPNGSLGRERIVALLWPDSPPGRGRHLLSEALYVLRKEMGEDAVRASGDGVALNPAVVDSDLARFRAALAAGDVRVALEWYRGPFLDGFCLEGADGFERWAYAERAAVSRAWEGALERHAGERAARGDRAGAVEAWRRWTAHDPYSARAAVGLMRALDAAGDRAAALLHARLHAVLLREELDAGPDPEVEALAAALRSAVGEDRLPPSAPPPAAGGERAPEAVGVAPPPPGRARRGRIAGATALLALVFLGGALLRGGGRTGSGRLEPPLTDARVAVLPFSVRGAPGSGYLADGIVHLLSAELDGAGGMRALDPHAVLSRAGRDGTVDAEAGRVLASALDADAFVVGTVVAVGGRLHLSASLFGVDGGVWASASATAEREAELPARLTELAARLLVGRRAGPEGHLERLAASTSDFPALKSYLQGEHHLRMERHDEAAAAFEEALARDSTFALAAYRLSIAQDWLGRKESALHAILRADRFADRLPHPDRLVVRGLLAYHLGAPAEAGALLREALAVRRSAVEAWYQLGEVEFHANPLLGLPSAAAREALRRTLALDPGHQGARMHLAWIAVRERDRPAFDAVVPGLRLASPLDSLRWRHLRAFAFADLPEQRRLEALYPALGEAELYGLSHDLLFRTDRYREARHLSRLLAARARSGEHRVAGHLQATWAEMILGQPAAARAELARLARVDPAAALQYRALLASLPFVPVAERELRALRDSLAAWDRPSARNPLLPLFTGMLPGTRAYLAGMLSARLGDREGVRLHAAEVRASPAEPGEGPAPLRARALEAALAAREGDAATALRLLDERHADPGAPFAAVNPFARHLRPALLRLLGRDGEALLRYAAGPWLGSAQWEENAIDLLFLAPFALEQARLLERQGRGAEAAARYRFVLDLWRDAEPSLLPLRAEASRGLARLARGGAP